MKLIDTTSRSNAATAHLPVATPIQEQPGHISDTRGFNAAPDDATLTGDASPVLSFSIVAVTPLSWDHSEKKVKSIRVSDPVRAWMDHDTAIRNWVRTCVMCFADLGKLFWTCPVPDQWRADMGAEIHISRIDEKTIEVIS